jgi:hypothetical protein
VTSTGTGLHVDGRTLVIKHCCHECGSTLVLSSARTPSYLLEPLTPTATTV